jgi:multidrug resistance efflux pump
MRGLWRHKALILFTIATIVGGGAFVWKVLRPAWEQPGNRTYTSRLGYASVLRREGRPFPVGVAQVATRDLDEVHVGEGLMQSTPVLVPVLPMAPITKVHVHPGDRVQAGQLLAELDASKIEIKVQSALTALETANAELQRVRVGSPQEMVDERPEADIVRLGTLAQEAEIKARALEWYTYLHEQGLVAAKDLIAKELDAVGAVGRQKEAELELQTAELGMAESLAIAESARKEAELAFEYRKLELLEYEIHAPNDGTIERVLVQPGEFNQDPGRPAFLMTSGLWFEARLDQASIGRVEIGRAHV